MPPAASVGDASDEAESANNSGPFGKGPKRTSGYVPDATATAIPSPDVDEDAMEIDSESPIANQSSPRTGKGPRLVPVAPTRPEWRENVSNGNIPSAVPSPGGKVPAGTVPTAVPNAAVPRPPPPPKAKKTRGSGKLDLGNLKNVTPFVSSAEGLHGMNDLSGTLPFESAPSSHPLKTFQAQRLELPAVPKPPASLPTNVRITNDQWRAYVGHMSVYMGSWWQFNNRMLEHFKTRHESAKKFGTGIANTSATKLLEAIGETSNEDGLASYLTGLEEDVRIRHHWDIASEKHREAVEAFAAVKARIKTEGILYT
jgi:hypothetical protein